MSIRVIITGATGMVGEGVMLECLQSAEVEAVTIISRKPAGFPANPKLTEIVHADFSELKPIEDKLKGFNACFFCAGVSSVNMKAKEYFDITYKMTTDFAQTLLKMNPESKTTFCYVTGAGTSSVGYPADCANPEKQGWKKIKGQTENDLMKMPFARVFAFRPGFIKPTEGTKNAHTMYKLVGWTFSPGRAMFANGFCTNQEIGVAMINCCKSELDRKVLEGKDIIEMAGLDKKFIKQPSKVEATPVEAAKTVDTAVAPVAPVAVEGEKVAEVEAAKDVVKAEVVAEVKLEVAAEVAEITAETPTEAKAGAAEVKAVVEDVKAVKEGLSPVTATPPSVK